MDMETVTQFSRDTVGTSTDSSWLWNARDRDNQVSDGLAQCFRPPRNYRTGLSDDRICEWQTAKGPGSLEAGLSGAVALSFLLTITFLPDSPLKKRRRRTGTTDFEGLVSKHGSSKKQMAPDTGKKENFPK